MRTFDLSRGGAIRIGAATLAAVALAPLPARAAFDAYMTFGDGSFPGIPAGQSIEIESFSFGAQTSTQSAATGGGAGKVRVSDLQITRKTDSASPKLFQACVSGQHISKLVLTGGGKTATFYDVIFSSLRKAGGDQLTEILTLSYTNWEDSQHPLPVLDHPITLAPGVTPPKKP
jgi:type VI secretion system secreted protein Hcp